MSYHPYTPCSPISSSHKIQDVMSILEIIVVIEVKSQLVQPNLSLHSQSYLRTGMEYEIYCTLYSVPYNDPHKPNPSEQVNQTLGNFTKLLVYKLQNINFEHL
ncbi:predicted protein [Sclerotinia sclerotiorum 1980 UF-70]|uniref:Uncharacterized protein n=1 Tax=Sclerotinia sclerotiorum (strain ATCC 18683 / 1980 / Ss-1) TaxID=665079 RepID=A7EUM4_SCLS1|nr:predicted protein [Sclerotinia sclerotiorum 1980 UF-70]EDN93166.1 predicted protein [Sclerotinia sclerotiorum 1980 UF-70]